MKIQVAPRNDNLRSERAETIIFQSQLNRLYILRPSAPKSTTNKHQDVNRNKHGGENPEKSLLDGKADGLEPRGLQGGAQGGKIYKPDQTTSSPFNSSPRNLIIISFLRRYLPPPFLSINQWQR